MKKAIAFLAASALFLSLCACSQAQDSTGNDNSPSKETTSQNHATESTTPQQSSPVTETEDPRDPYVAMLRSDRYYASGKESTEYRYNLYTSAKDSVGYVILKEYLGTSHTVSLPDTIDNAPVIGMYHSIFEKCSFVEEVTFPKNLRTVIWNTRSDISTCMTNTNWYQKQPDGLYYAGNVVIGYKGEMPANHILTFPEGTIGVGGGALRQDNLVGIQIPNSMLMFSDDAFSGSGLTEVTIPKTLQYYFGAFGCQKLKRVIFEEGITEIYGTVSASSVEEVVLPSTLEIIGDKAFMNCENLKTLVLPANVKTIGECAFYSSGLTHIELNDGLERIKDEAFMLCRDLKSIFIPASVYDIGQYALGFVYEDTLVKGFTAYFEVQHDYMEYLKNNGIACEIGTRAS